MNDEQFETFIVPTYEKYEEFLRKSAITEHWPYHPDYFHVWNDGLENLWLILTYERGTDKLVAGLSLALNHSEPEKLYSIAVYYCVPEHRGTGVASAVFRRAMDIVGGDNCVLCTGPLTTQLYAKLGCDKMDMPWMIRHKIPVSDIVYPELDSLEPSDYIIKKISEVDINIIHTFDRTIYPLNREKLLFHWFQAKNTVASKVVLNKNGTVCGFIHITSKTDGTATVGPFYAENEKAATALLYHALKSTENIGSYNVFSFLYPETNKTARSVLSQFSSSPVEYIVGSRAQFTQRCIKYLEDKVFSVTETAHGFM